MSANHRLLILDDGESWETVSDSSCALLVGITEAELDRLQCGERVEVVLGGRLGRRLASLIPSAIEGVDNAAMLDATG